MDRFDYEHIIHPYASHRPPIPAYKVTRAQGVRLRIEGHGEVIDGMSSWWCAIHGYNHPRLNAALSDQAERFAHVMFGGLTHDPAIELAKRLLDLTEGHFDEVFFADSGSVSVEVALKMAWQYQKARGESRRTKILAFEKSYHGDTFGAMNVCDPVTGMHALFRGILPEQIFCAPPPDEEDFLAKMQAHGDEIAAVIIEPVVQGAGGMRFYDPSFLKLLRQECDKRGILLIFDEIATGFGRTGELFAYRHAGVVPDIMTVGKALTGGYMTLAAVLTTSSLMQTLEADGHVLMHGPTFMANPLACRVACESIDLLLESPWQARVRAIEEQMRKELAACCNLPIVKDVRVLGAIGVVQLNRPVDLAWMTPRFVERGVWIRPFSDLVYIMPPYIITPEELGSLTRAIYKVIAEYGRKEKP